MKNAPCSCEYQRFAKALNKVLNSSSRFHLNNLFLHSFRQCMTKLKHSGLPWWGDKFNRFFMWGHQQLLLSQLPASFLTSYMIHNLFHIYHHKRNICILCSNSTSTFRELMIISLHFPRTELSVTLGGGNVTTLFSWGVEGADNEDFVLGDGELLRLDLSLFGVFLSPCSSGFPPDFSLS